MRRKHLRIWQMAGSDGRAYAVRRAGARTLWTDRRVRRQRTGDVRTRRTAGVRTVGRLRRVRRIRSLGLRVARLRARSSGRGRGGLRENCRTLVSYAFGRPKFFCKRRVLPCGNSCGMCVSLKKIRPPRGRTPCRPVPRGKRLPPRRKKNTRPPRRGYHRSMAQGTPSEKNSLLLKKTPPFMKKNARYLKKAILPALRGLAVARTPNCGEFWRSGERGFLVLLFSWNQTKSPKFVSLLRIFSTSSAMSCSPFYLMRVLHGYLVLYLPFMTNITVIDCFFAILLNILVF